MMLHLPLAFARPLHYKERQVTFKTSATRVRMDWTDEPATWRQLKSLKELGYTLEHRLTKVEAAEIIRSLGGKEEPAVSATVVAERPTIGPLQLRHKAEQARRAMAVAGWNKTEK